MDDTPTTAIVPAGWAESLAESEAQLAAGQIVSGDDVPRELDECIARLQGSPKTPRRRFSSAPSAGDRQHSASDVATVPAVAEARRGRFWGKGGLVELRGIEPLTSSLRTRRSPN